MASFRNITKEIKFQLFLFVKKMNHTEKFDTYVVWQVFVWENTGTVEQMSQFCWKYLYKTKQ